MKELDFRGLADFLLGLSRELCVKWLPGGELKGKEYVCGNLLGSPGESCSVNIDTGRWADFANDQKGGDFISLYAAIQNIEQGVAAKQLAFEHNYNLQTILAEPYAERK
ncbi:MAG: hypothetical protein IIC93_08805 [Chloroflexi bacterium]|nr:hypothetical protein [Chloroflexota bacterium]